MMSNFLANFLTYLPTPPVRLYTRMNLQFYYLPIFGYLPQDRASFMDVPLLYGSSIDAVDISYLDAFDPLTPLFPPLKEFRVLLFNTDTYSKL